MLASDDASRQRLGFATVPASPRAAHDRSAGLMRATLCHFRKATHPVRSRSSIGFGRERTRSTQIDRRPQSEVARFAAETARLRAGRRAVPLPIHRRIHSDPNCICASGSPVSTATSCFRMQLAGEPATRSSTSISGTSTSPDAEAGGIDCVGAADAPVLPQFAPRTRALSPRDPIWMTFPSFAATWGSGAPSECTGRAPHRPLRIRAGSARQR
jgi:hypothetical protein